MLHLPFANTMTYVIPETLCSDPVTMPLLSASVSVARFDEQLKASPLRDGFLSRLCYHEALACQLAEGDLVPMEDLVLLDGRVFNGTPYGALSQAFYTLRTWQRASAADPAEVLRSDHPGEIRIGADDDGHGAGPVSHGRNCDPERLEAWRRVCRETEALPPMLAAAIVWDAWLVIEPDHFGAWRAPLLAGLTLKRRGLTSAFLVPFDYGRRFAPYRRDPRHGLAIRIAGFLSWADCAIAQCQKDLQRLVTAKRQLRRTIGTCRKSSKLPQLVDLFLSRPVVSIPLACGVLRVRKQSVVKMLPKLSAHVRELTDRQRYRAWAVNQVVSRQRQ